MFLSSAFIVLSFLLYVLYWFKTKHRNYLFSKIPSPKKYFLLHNTPEILGLDQTKLFKKIQYFYSELGDVFHLTFHPLDSGILFVADYEIAKDLSNFQPDRKRSIFYEFLLGWVGTEGAFFASKSVMKSKLKFIKYVLNQKFHQNYLKIAKQHHDSAIRNLKEKGVKQIEISSWYSKVILDISFGKKILFFFVLVELIRFVFLAITTGMDLGSKEEKNSEYFFAYEKYENKLSAPFRNP
jgi:hypothetical protein